MPEEGLTPGRAHLEEEAEKNHDFYFDLLKKYAGGAQPESRPGETPLNQGDGGQLSSYVGGAQPESRPGETPLNQRDGGQLSSSLDIPSRIRRSQHLHGQPSIGPNEDDWETWEVPVPVRIHLTISLVPANI